MVFRKPYAFLIKNFKKIHILMLILWGFVYYKIYNLRSFVKEFVSFGTYNENLEGISTKVTASLFAAAIFLILISIALLFLLRHKKKPWKLYLVIIVEYILMIYDCASLTSFFNSYTNDNLISEVFIYRDILNIVNIVQYFVLIILLMRITGLDLKKFSFNTDQEFLELSSQDREEFEVNIEIDKHSFIRKYNSLKRNINYFYQEHKFLCNVAIVLIVVSLVGYNYYHFGIKNKSYKEGETFSAGIYSIKINNAYVTDKDTMGNLIEKNNKFVIIDVTMKNNSSEKIEPNFSRFHLMNKNINRVNTIYYDNSFTDMGKSVAVDNEISGGEEKRFILVYKVSNKLDNKYFTLYYQEYQGVNKTYLRKIKLNINDVTKIKDVKNYNMGEQIKFKFLSNTTKEITLEEYKIGLSDGYYKYMCDSDGNCGVTLKEIQAENGYQILKISFASSDFEGEEFIDFSSKYGRIKYVDNNGKVGYSKMIDLIDTDYEGKEIFLKVSSDIINASEINLEYILRNKEYIVKIK